jgi:ribose 5-phosphate isomerase B
MAERVAIASDHAGVEMKSALGAVLRKLGFEVLDLGTTNGDSVDYPDFAEALADAFRTGRTRRGVLICGTGIGISIAANRHRELRAAVCHDGLTARLARQHNDANVLCLGARVLGPETAKDCVETFFTTAFEGGERHERRVAKLSRPLAAPHGAS